MNFCFRFLQGVIQVEFFDFYLDVGGMEYFWDGQGFFGLMLVLFVLGFEGGLSFV